MKLFTGLNEVIFINSLALYLAQNTRYDFIIKNDSLKLE